MNQPDLGNKIAELRKAKGFTQEELVEKCNISVRTLQRIESGEVTPRSYTIKTIFSVLDYPFFISLESTPGKFSKTEFIILNRVGQFYKYVLDLFNLKTNTMKKISILSVPAFTLFFVFLFLSIQTNGQEKTEIREKIEKANHRFIQLFNSGQIDSLGYLYLDSANLIFDNIFPVFNDNLPSINGREGIKAYYTLYHHMGLKFIKKNSKNMVIADSIVVDIGTLLLKSNSGSNITGTYFCQWHYINKNWLIENEMFNFDK